MKRIVYLSLPLWLFVFDFSNADYGLTKSEECDYIVRDINKMLVRA